MNNQYDPEALHCCYLLTSLNPKFKNHTYIGYTVDPIRRLRQHNGELDGGAVKTQKKRPWHMVLFVHGFICKNAGLRFEWAWQNPKTSLLTREAVAVLEGLGNKDHLKAKMRTLYEMLNLLPFARFPLTVNFLTAEYHKYLENCPKPPLHMKVLVANGHEFLHAWKGRQKVRELPQNDLDLAILCDLCQAHLPRDEDPNCAAECMYVGCAMRAHVTCLAKHFLRSEPHQLIPTVAACPVCQGALTWHAVVLERQKRKKQKLANMNLTF